MECNFNAILRLYIKAQQTFTDDDIVNMYPIVKHISPRATDAYNFYTTGGMLIIYLYIYDLVNHIYLCNLLHLYDISINIHLINLKDQQEFLHLPIN